MGTGGPESNYVLGNTDAEHERLIRQSARLAPCTERLFREAGIASGHRVLDLGSGVGDVAMLAARLVGPSGQVVGIERDARSLARAKARAAGAELSHVTFMQSDASDVAGVGTFDALVGRFILQFLPDPLSVIRHLRQLLRPGGIIAFQEVTFTPFLALNASLPLWAGVASLAHETIRKGGASTEIGLALHQVFQDAGFPAPAMRIEILLGSDPGFTRWTCDLLLSMRPELRGHGASLGALGDLATLPDRLQAEVTAARAVVPFVGLVGAWSRKPDA